MLQNILAEIDAIKYKLSQLRHFNNPIITQALDIEYTYESNKIEGNTLTLQETQLVIEKGLTIGGKPLKEHLEATNHYFAIEFIYQLVKEQTIITETIIKQIHQLVLQGIDNTNAGKYRSVPVLISGAIHVPPQPYLVPKLMEDLIIWYNEAKGQTHPVILSAEMHQRLVSIHPFTDGNGRTSRLLMNLILLQHGYQIAILKGDVQSRLKYYECLEIAQTQNNPQPFNVLIANTVKQAMDKIVSLVEPQ